MPTDTLTHAELAAENERLKLACQAYRKFIQAEMHFEGYRGEFYGQKASEQNCLKLEAWLKEHGLETAGDDLLAELAALRVQVAWRPIETAPRDGTDIIATNHASGVYIGAFYGPTFMTSIGYCKREPTHWQPLPEPPADQLSALDQPEGA